MVNARLIALLSSVGVVLAQVLGTQKAETRPVLMWSKCSKAGCEKQKGEVVIDSNWRWLHTPDGSKNCYTGQKWDCTDEESCTGCALDGADYQGTYGVTATGDAITLSFVTGNNYGSRLYLMHDNATYEMFTLLGKEFAFDVDVSELECGLNGALYFVNMDADGGMKRFPSNQAGAARGTGYCDSQCPRDPKFVGGKANSADWVPSKYDANSGVGGMGGCCAEMDIWEANKMASAFTLHPCKTPTYEVCKGDADCGGTYSTERYGKHCDPDGCDFNAYRMGDPSFYGPGKTIDTTKKITVVTQFIGSGETLQEIKRFYVQDGKVIPNSESKVNGVKGNSLTPDLCKNSRTVFGDRDATNEFGGFEAMGKSLATPAVLAMSIWSDTIKSMLWLDSSYPADKDAASPGVTRGPCDVKSGQTADVRGKYGSAKVTYSNIKFGDIGSTFDSSGTTITSSTTTGNSSVVTSSISTTTQVVSGDAGDRDKAMPMSSTSPSPSSGLTPVVAGDVGDSMPSAKASAAEGSSSGGDASTSSIKKCKAKHSGKTKRAVPRAGLDADA
ncbi:hypothetical protein PYCC9005_004449 [Savitreella phatthalungensis]